MVEHELLRLCGLLRLLRHDVSDMLALDASVQRLLLSLLQLCELDVGLTATSSQPLQAATPRHAGFTPEYYRPPFMYVTGDARFYTLITRLLTELAMAGCWGLVTTKLITIARSGVGSKYHSEAAWLLVMMLSVADGESVAAEDVVRAMCALLELVTTATRTRTTTVHRLRQALLIQALGSAVDAIGGAALRFHVYRLLYPVLEHLADDDVSVRQSALATLARMQCALHPHESADIVAAVGDGREQVAPRLVSALLTGNVDYVIDGLCRRLRRIDEHPNTPAVADCIARHSSIQLVFLMKVCALVCLCADVHAPHASTVSAGCGRLCAGQPGHLIIAGSCRFIVACTARSPCIVHHCECR